MPKRPNMVAQPELCRCLGSTSGVGGRFMESIALLVSGHTMPYHAMPLHYTTLQYNTYIYTYRYRYTYSYMYIYICVCVCTCGCVPMCTHMFTYLTGSMCVCISVYIYHRRRLLSINPSHLTSISFSCSSI